MLSNRQLAMRRAAFRVTRSGWMKASTQYPNWRALYAGISENRVRLCKLKRFARMHGVGKQGGA